MKAFEHLGATTGIELLNCLAARSQTLQCFGKVCQQLRYLCESAVQRPERQYSMRSILWGVHLLGHAVKEVPRFVKSMPKRSDVMKRTVLVLHARNTLLERCF